MVAEALFQSGAHPNKAQNSIHPWQDSVESIDRSGGAVFKDHKKTEITLQPIQQLVQI